jgi:hypothetical protein
MQLLPLILFVAGTLSLPLPNPQPLTRKQPAIMVDTAVLVTNVGWSDGKKCSRRARHSGTFEWISKIRNFGTTHGSAHVGAGGFTYGMMQKNKR